MRQNRSVFGIYMDRMRIQEVLDTLRMDGFRTADISVLFPDNPGSQAPESCALGLLKGVGALAVPGFGPFIAAGPIIGALAEASAVGRLGGVAGGLMGLGMPEYEARLYEDRILNGGILISVDCDDADWTRRAKITLDYTGAYAIVSTAGAEVDFALSSRAKRSSSASG